MKDEVLSILVHGASKVGKSTLGSTAPPPILVVDAEGSWKFIDTFGFKGKQFRRILWDPMLPPPRYDGTWDVCHVMVTNWDSMRRIYQWLTQTEHDFVSVILDSITELQRRCKANLAPEGIIKGYDGWGLLLVQMDQLIRSFRDLTIKPGPVRLVMYVAETREESGKWRPYMQGQISTSLPYWVDICAYMYQTKEADENNNLTISTPWLYVGSHPQFESGERVQGRLGDSIRNPSITEILTTIYPTLKDIDERDRLGITTAGSSEGGSDS